MSVSVRITVSRVLISIASSRALSEFAKRTATYSWQSFSITATLRSRDFSKADCACWKRSCSVLGCGHLKPADFHVSREQPAERTAAHHVLGKHVRAGHVDEALVRVALHALDVVERDLSIFRDRAGLTRELRLGFEPYVGGCGRTLGDRDHTQWAVRCVGQKDRAASVPARRQPVSSARCACGEGYACSVAYTIGGSEPLVGSFTTASTICRAWYRTLPFSIKPGT